MTNEEREIQRKLKVLQHADILVWVDPASIGGVMPIKSLVRRGLRMPNQFQRIQPIKHLPRSSRRFYIYAANIISGRLGSSGISLATTALKSRMLIFKRFHTGEICIKPEPEFILLVVRWYCRYALPCRDVRDLLSERGVEGGAATMYRWVVKSEPEISKQNFSHRDWLN